MVKPVPVLAPPPSTVAVLFSTMMFVKTSAKASPVAVTKSSTSGRPVPGENVSLEDRLHAVINANAATALACGVAIGYGGVVELKRVVAGGAERKGIHRATSAVG